MNVFTEALNLFNQPEAEIPLAEQRNYDVGQQHNYYDSPHCIRGHKLENQLIHYLCFVQIKMWREIWHPKVEEVRSTTYFDFFLQEITQIEGGGNGEET